MKISKLVVNNFVGIKELEWNPSLNLNFLNGPKGTGKTSIIESIDKAFSNKNRRKEVISHGENESTIFLETNTGLTIDRRIRKESTDYLKLRNKGEGISSTEKELRKLVSGNIFRPLDFLDMPTKKQTEEILNLVKMNYNLQDIEKWFGKNIMNGIAFDDHILKTLKNVEEAYYKQREEIGRYIKLLKAQIEGIQEELPDNYDGYEWKEVKISEIYKELSTAQEINKKLFECKKLIENKEMIINESQEKKKMKMQEIENLATIEKQNILNSISEVENNIEISDRDISKFNFKKQHLENKYKKILEEEIKRLASKYDKIKQDEISILEAEVQNKKQDIINQKEKIKSMKNNIDKIESRIPLQKQIVHEKHEKRLVQENAKIQEAIDFETLNDYIDTEHILEKIKNTEHMKSFIREWDKLHEIKNGKLKFEEKKYNDLTEIIGIARNMPKLLLQKHNFPIKNISIDQDGSIRINGTLLDGLSEGEALELSLDIAINKMGELKIICLDGFNKLSKEDQKKVVDICMKNNLQAFVTITEDVDESGFEINMFSDVNGKLINRETGEQYE